MNGPNSFDRYERWARLLGMVIGQVGFPILVAAFLLLKFDATLTDLGKRFGELTAAVQELIEEQRRTTSVNQNTNRILERGGRPPSEREEP